MLTLTCSHAHTSIGSIRLCRWLSKPGRSQASLAVLVGVSQQTISKFVIGQLVPLTYGVVTALHRATGIKPSEWTRPAPPPEPPKQSTRPAA